MKALLFLLFLQYVSFASGVTSSVALRVVNFYPGSQVSAHVASPTVSEIATEVNYKEVTKYVYVPAGASIRVVRYQGTSAVNVGNFTVFDARDPQTDGYFTLAVGLSVTRLWRDQNPLQDVSVSRVRFAHLSDYSGSINITIGENFVSNITRGGRSAYLNVSANIADPMNVVKSFSAVSAASTMNSEYPFFPGRTYTVWLQGTVDPAPASNSYKASFFVTQDSYAPEILASETFENLCANISCPPGFTCRNGRCLNTTEKCRDYSGFDVVEVARDVLLYVDNQIQSEINTTIRNLQRLREAVDRYDPNTRRLNLIPYLKALDAFCGGRNCTDTDCSNPSSGCTTLECQYPNSSTCPGLRQIEFLQAAFLGAVAVLNPGAACLAPYTAQ